MLHLPQLLKEKKSFKYQKVYVQVGITRNAEKPTSQNKSVEEKSKLQCPPPQRK